jgi:predicted Zn-dependent protease
MNSARFFELATRLFSALTTSEIAFLYLRGEASSFIRFNAARVRQSGDVDQLVAHFTLIDDGRHTSTELSLTGQLDRDLGHLLETLTAMRAIVQAVPRDPYLCYDSTPRENIAEGDKVAVAPAEALTDILDIAKNQDLVGLWSSGTIERGLASSFGHRYWKEMGSFNFNFTIYAQRDKAAKGAYAGTVFDRAVLAERIDRAAEQADILRRPEKRLDPGTYRVFLTPTALSELLLMISGDAFSVKAQRTKQTPLLRMLNGEGALDARVTISEHPASSLAPRFLPFGFWRPEQICLINGGKVADALVSPRSAREYQLSVNAPASERPSSIAMAPGTLANQEVLSRLGTGVYVTDLWYTNYSDLPSGRITGLTRFATMWVENGRLVAPSSVMRFDDTLSRIFGSELEAITSERELIYDDNTYLERSTDSLLLPGILLRAFVFSL